MDGRMDQQMDAWTNRWTEGQTDRRTEGRTDNWMDGQNFPRVLQDIVPYQVCCPKVVVIIVTARVILSLFDHLTRAQ